MLIGLGVLAAVGIFALDCLLPLGVAIGALYMIPVLIGLWIPNKKYIHVIALSGGLLIIVGYFLSPPGGDYWLAIANRGLSLVVVWIFAAVCLLQKKTQEKLDRENAFMRLLQDVAVAVNEAKTFEGAVQACLDKVCSVTGWPVGHVYLLGNDPHTLIPTSIWRLDNPDHFKDFVSVTEKTPRVSGAGMPGRVLQTGKPAWSVDVTQDPDCPRSKVAQSTEVKGGYAFPLLIKDEVVGVLEFFSARAAAPDDLLLGVMASIGIQCGRVIERDRINKIEEETRKNLENHIRDRTEDLSRTNQELQNEILEHKRAEEKAEHYNRQNELILTSAAEGIFGLDLQGHFTFVNPAAAQLFARARVEIIGQPVEIILNPQKNDESAPLENVSPLYAALKDCISCRATDEAFWRKDGTSFPVEYTCTSSVEQGVIVGAVITFKNIAERKHAEKLKEKLLLDLEHVNNELGEFAYIVAHDLKEPVRGVSSLAQWIAEDYAPLFDDNGRAQMQLLIDNTIRMHRLIDGILAYCRVGREKPEISRLDLGEVIGEIIGSFKIPDNIRVYAEGELPVVWFFRLHLEQVLQNLIGNAIKHLGKPEGAVVVSCRDAGEVWELCVRDNGIGIEERHFNRIFKIFQVLKKEENYADSTGIGLALVRKIADIHREEVWVESEVGKGTSFYFTITKNFKDNMEV